MSCLVAPGFDFADFTLLRDVPQERDAFLVRHPGEGTALEQPLPSQSPHIHDLLRVDLMGRDVRHSTV